MCTDPPPAGHPGHTACVAPSSMLSGAQWPVAMPSRSANTAAHRLAAGKPASGSTWSIASPFSAAITARGAQHVATRRRVLHAASALPAERAAVVINRDTPPGQLRVAEIPLPECDDDELLVEVHAAGVNALDRLISSAIQSVPAFLRLNPGYVPGKDISGVVVGVGSRVSDFREGDAVFGMAGFALSASAISQLSGDKLSRGGFTTYTTLKAAQTAKKPPNISHVQAAGIPLAGLTAWKAIVETARIREGSKVLILGGAGGVGTLAIQLAKRYGTPMRWARKQISQ